MNPPPAPVTGARPAPAGTDGPPTEEPAPDEAPAPEPPPAEAPTAVLGAGGDRGSADLPARAVLAATWLVVLLGAALRLRQWSTGRAFWLDELLLVRAMGAQRLHQVLEPLGFSQSAPPGWLLVQHVVLHLSGGDERAARMLPLLFGVGALVLAALLARTLLGGPAALVATAATAVSPQLIGYSDEFKQYSSDVFWVLLVLLLGCRLALGRGRAGPGRVALAAVAAVGAWFSHAGALVTLGVFAALGLLALAHRRPRELLALAGCAVPFGAGLAAEYVLLLRKNADNDVLQAYWTRAFPPPGPLTWSGALDWFAGRTVALAASPLDVEHSWLLLVLLLAGLLVLGLRRPPALPVLLLPVAVVVAAGLAGSYPIAGRLALFLVPMLALVLAAPLDLPALAARIPLPGARTAATLLAGALAVAAAIGLVVLLQPQAGTTWHAVGRPQQKQESRTVLELLAGRRQPGDLVLVDGRGARHAAAFYGPRVGAGPFEVLEAAPPAAACRRVPLGRRLHEQGRHGRVWLIASHTRPVDLELYRAQLSHFGPVGETLTATGATAIRFDRSAAPVPSADPPDRRCLRIVDPATLP